MAMLLATSFLLLAICFIFLPFIASTRSLQDPELVVQEVNRELDASRRRLGYFSCGTGNSIDDCWRCDRNWANNRRRLADCSIGFGRSAIGGKYGKIYVVTDSTDKDAVNPKPGTLRYGVLQDEPLWIIFARDMVIKLKEELIMTSFKTLDGRGVHVEIAYGGCLTIQNVKHIIIHGLNIHDCAITGNAWVRSSMSHFGLRGKTDGDGITVFGSSHVWVDHCSLSKCKDGLIDVVAGSSLVTISNNHFTHHNEVMLLGHSDSYVADKGMYVTVVYNHFGEGLIQRMPRCRHGYFHVVNNDYTHWEMYAIGGSGSPTIFSQGNRFNASNNRYAKHVVHKITPYGNYLSRGDLMMNGAIFNQSGSTNSSSYSKASSLAAKALDLNGIIIDRLTRDAGVLSCTEGKACSV